MRDYLDDRPIKLRRERLAASRRPFALALLLGLVALALLFLDQRGTLPVRGVLQQGLSPVAQQLTNLRDGIAGVWSGISDVQNLRAENEALQRQVSKLQADLIAAEQDTLELARLRQQLAIQEGRPWQLLGAEVAIRSPDAGRRVITIARGSQDGVAPGMAVVGQTGSGPAALVGIVEEVGARTADVLLITDFGSRVSARVLHDGTAALGLVQGQWQRGSRLRLEQIEREATLASGDVVVSAGLSRMLNVPLAMSAVPADIPIGSVETVGSDGHWQVAELRPFADPDEVRYVWVILGETE